MLRFYRPHPTSRNPLRFSFHTVCTDLVTEEQVDMLFECLSLTFRGGASLLIPGIEAGRVWRYGASGTLMPDRLEGSAWQERRRQAEEEIQTTAARLVVQLREHQAETAPAVEPTQEYRRFMRMMPFAATRDQMQAIRAVQQDLGAGHPAAAGLW